MESQTVIHLDRTISKVPPLEYRLLSYNTNKLRAKVYAPSDGYVLFNDGYDEDWIAKVNGKTVSILLSNGGFKSIQVSEGISTIEFKYTPLGVLFATWTFIGINLFALLW